MSEILILKEHHLEKAIENRKSRKNYNTCRHCFVGVAAKEQIPGFLDAGYSVLNVNEGGQTHTLHNIPNEENDLSMSQITNMFDEGHFEDLRHALAANGGRLRLEFA